jgi:outer membrane protein W
VNFSAVTFGMTKKNLRVNDFDVDPYRSSFGYLTSRSERAGVGYDLELGLMLTNNIEVFTNLGFSYERPFEKLILVRPPFNPLYFDFKARRSFEVSLGGRYYWNLDNRWYPFVGIMGTGIIQEPIKSEAFSKPNRVNYISLRNFTLLDRTMLWGGAIQGGADYQFTQNVSLSFSVSLRYTPRTSRKSIVVNGFQLSSRENRSLWSLPAIVSLKFLI